MLRNGPRCTLGPEYTRSSSDTRGPGTTMILPGGLNLQTQRQNGGIPLANSICHLLPHRALTTCSRYGHASSDSDVLEQAIRSAASRTPTAMGRTDKSDRKKPSTRGEGNEYSCHSHQESKWTNPERLHKIWYRHILYGALIYCNTYYFESIFANRFLFIY